MSAAGGIGERPGLYWRRVGANVRETFATLTRTPRPPGRSITRPPVGTIAIAAGLAIAAMAGSMLLLDGSSVAIAQAQSARLSEAFSRFTNSGLSGWFLYPLGLTLIAIALIDSSALPRFSHLVLSAWSVRLGFLFTAIALPGLMTTLIKRVVGRARPLVENADIWTYQPFGWEGAYASLPSGHATTAFSALVAIGAIFPQARALLWIYAVLISLSRIAVHAHYPSDVIAGGIVGALGALLVRNWFAARRLGFFVGSDGAVHALPGPSLRHLKGVARRALSA